MFWCKPKKEDTAKTEHKSSRLDQSWSKHMQTQHSERIVISQGYEGFNRLRGEFKREIQENTNKVRDYTDKLNYLKHLAEMQRLPSPHFYFSTIKKYFAANLSEWQKDQNSSIIIENVVHVYQELAKSKRAEKQLAACVYFYLDIVKQVLSGNEVWEETHDLLSEYGETMKGLNNGLLCKFEEAIKLAKKMSIRQKEQAHREEHGLIAEIRELKAQIKGMADPKCGNHSSSNSNHESSTHTYQDRNPKQKVFNRAPQKYECHQQKIDKRDVICERLMAQLQAEKRKNKDLSERLKQYQKRLESVQDCIEVAKRNIFAGDLLDTHKQEKRFLLETIQKQIGKSISNTKFIYDFRKHKKSNFNTRIDGHQNLVLILKTKNALIGCFYAGKYQHRTPLEGVAILMSLDNKKYYLMKTTRGSEGMIYDYDSLIYGREELVIYKGDQYASSNFGIDNGYFDNKKDNVHALLREGTAKKAEIINYQIYEAYFQGQPSNKDDIPVC